MGDVLALLLSAYADVMLPDIASTSREREGGRERERECYRSIGVWLSWSSVQFLVSKHRCSLLAQSSFWVL